MVFDKINKSFSGLFTILMIIEVISSKTESLSMLHNVAMPLLLACLILFFSIRSLQLNPRTRRLMLLALVLSLLGDILIFKNFKLFEESNLLGLMSHALAHVMYAIVFLQKINKDIKPYLALFFLLMYSIGFVIVIYPLAAGNFLIILINFAVVFGMIFAALFRKNSVPKESYLLVLIGAISLLFSYTFVVSDNYFDIMFIHEFVMLPYAAAHLLIVIGVLKQNDKKLGYHSQ